MKYFSILVLLFFTFVAFSQDGFYYLKKAHNRYKKGKYNQSLYYLNQAENSDFGFCGNAWETSEGEIKILRARIYDARKEYDKALREIIHFKGCSLGADCSTADYLKVQILIHKYGKDRISNIFNSETSFIRCYDLNSYITLKIKEINEVFTFYPMGIYDFKNENYPFNEFIKKLEFYKLIE
ncbi:hypothetical protein [Flavobacterium oreochromis]|uniref:hypothetical protein n=1 Tax=Flavobacterium oreochromis TaxID=2906078 RepID=UPI00385E3F31